MGLRDSGEEQEHLKSIGVVCPLLEPLEVAKATIFGALLEALQAPTAQLVTQAPGLLCRLKSLDVRASARCNTAGCRT